MNGLPAFAGICSPELPQGASVNEVTIAHPDGWRVGDRCEFFDPVMESLPEATEPGVAVTWYVADVAYADAAQVSEEIEDPIRYVGARGGYQAVRIEGTATGTGLRPPGEPVALWLVDLGSRTLVGSAQETDEVRFDLARRAMDRMAGTILVDPPAVPADGPIVVTRQEGGGMPFTVTYDHECFRLHAGGPEGEVQDEACDTGPVSQDDVATVLLDGGDLPVLAGLAPPRAHRVTVPAASGLFGAVTTSLEGAAAFAMHVRQPPFEVTVTDVAGDTLTTAEIEG